MKVASILVGLSVAGIIFCFGMSVYTAVQAHHEAANPPPMTIPAPAIDH